MPKNINRKKPLLSVVLPVFNEESNAEKAIASISDFLKKKKIKAEIIIVNDGSTDSTAKILERIGQRAKNLTTLTHKKNLGYGAALRSGFGRAHGELIFFTDSDCQFDIKEIDNFLPRIKDYDFVVGYRKKRKDPFLRLICAFFFRGIAELFFGIKVRDVNCAFKLFRADALKSLNLFSSGALINLEIFASAKSKRYKFFEMPVTHYPRTAGKQTGGSFMVLLKAFLNIFVLRLKIKISDDSKKILKTSLIFIVFTLLFAYFSFFVVEGYLPSFFKILNRWDVPNYLDIAKNGYLNYGQAKYLAAFFPFYPFLIRVFAFFSRNYFVSGLVVSNLCYILAMIFFYRLALLDFGKKAAWRTIFLLSVFPTAYFLHIGYSESAFLVLTIASFYCARKQKWFFCAALASLAGLTRNTGIILFPALVLEYLWQKKFRLKRIKKDIFWLGLIPFGFLFYLFVNHRIFGNAFWFLTAMKERWFKFLSWPWTGLVSALRGFGWRSPYDMIMVSGAEILFVALGLFLTVFAIFRLRPSYGFYSAANQLILVCTSFWLSTPRYLLSVFPLFLVLALLTETKKRLVLTGALFFAAQGVFFFLFVSDRWAF